MFCDIETFKKKEGEGREMLKRKEGEPSPVFPPLEGGSNSCVLSLASFAFITPKCLSVAFKQQQRSEKRRKEGFAVRGSCNKKVL